MGPLTVAEPQWIFKNAESEKIVIVDTRRLIDYMQGHIPSSISIPFTSYVKMKGLSNDLPDKKSFEKVLSEKGVSRDHLVVAYDDYAGRHASRLLYTMEVYGHQRLGILDRPFSTYVEEGFEVVRQETNLRPTNYEATIHENMVATKEIILSSLQHRHEGKLLLDTRPSDDYKYGHIPTARNLPWYLFGTAQRSFRPTHEIQTLLRENSISSDMEIITYCDEGTSSVYASYALRLAECLRVQNYPLSYGEWGADPALPKEKS